MAKNELDRLTELEKNITIAQKALSDARIAKATADAHVQSATAELAKYGVTPETAADALDQCTKDIGDSLTAAENLIPVELLKQLKRM